jgi:hypothetical protein
VRQVYDATDFSALFIPDSYEAFKSYEYEINTSVNYNNNPHIWSLASGVRVVATLNQWDGESDNNNTVHTFVVDDQGDVSQFRELMTSPSNVMSAGLANDHIAVLAKSENNIDSSTLTVFSADGEVIGEPLPFANSWQGGDINPLISKDNKLVLCSTKNEVVAGQSKSTLMLEQYDAQFTLLASAEIYSVPEQRGSPECHLQALNNGGFVAVHETYSQLGIQTSATVVDATLRSLKTQVLSQDSMQQVATATTDNGKIAITYEVSGPDYVAYAVLDAQGEFIKTPEVISAHEPEEVFAFAFNDNSFAIGSTDYETSVATMWLLDSNANLIPGEDFISPYDSFSNGRITTLPGSTEDSFKLFFNGYNAGFAFTEVYKNRLSVDYTGDTAVTVSNQSAHDVDVIVTVIGGDE